MYISTISRLYFIVNAVISMLINEIKVVKFAAFRGKMPEFVAVGQNRELCESHEGREKFTKF